MPFARIDLIKEKTPDYRAAVASIVYRGIADVLQPHWLWRAVDQDGYVLDEIPQTRRNTRAARRLLTRLLSRRQGTRPKRMVMDKLRSYGTARRKLTSSIRHLSHKGLNNRTENSHLPPR